MLCVYAVQVLCQRDSPPRNSSQRNRVIAYNPEAVAGSPGMVTFLLILHGLVGVALLGALTHQMTSLLRRRVVRSGSFADRYSGVNQRTFTAVVIGLYVVGVI